MQNIPVQDVMTTDLITVQTDETLTKIAEVFKTHVFNHIPIVDKDHCLKGIISRLDFERTKHGATLFRNPEIDKYNEVLFQTLLAKEIMTEGVVHLRPKDSIQSAYKIFKERPFRALPVVEKGILVGIVTPLDILDYYFQKAIV